MRWHLDGVTLPDEPAFVRAWFASRVPASVAPLDVAAADAALALRTDAAGLRAFGVPTAQLRAWALALERASVADTAGAEALDMKP